MTILSVILSCICFIMDIFLLGKVPIEFTKKRKKLSILFAVLINIWFCVVSLVNPVTAQLTISHAIMLNLLLIMSVTDMIEKMVYDMHFYIFLLFGAVSAFFQTESSFWMHYIVFGVVFGILFLVSRKREDIGMADIRTIAAMALFFPLSQWMETIILSLLSALIYGVVCLILKRITIKNEIAFIPFLLLGTLLELTAQVI